MTKVDALELIGGYFVEFVVRAGYSKMLRSLGTTLDEFLLNLNQLHHNLEREFRTAVFPSFEISRVKTNHDHDQEEEEEFLLRYSSMRAGLGLAPLAKGVVQKVASVLFDMQIEIEELSRVESEQVERMLEQPLESSLATQRAPAEDEDADGGDDDDAAAISQGVSWLIRIPRPPSPITPHSPPPVGNAPQQAGAATGRAAEASSSSPSLFSSFDLHQALCSVGRCCTSAASAVCCTVDCSAECAAPPSAQAALDDVDAAIFTARGVEIAEGERLFVAAELFRGVLASQVAGAWSEPEALERAGDFWSKDLLASAAAASRRQRVLERAGEQPPQPTEDEGGGGCYYAWSREVLLPRCGGRYYHAAAAEEWIPGWQRVLFVSHAWSPPPGWAELMGAQCRYGDVKAAEVCIAAKDLAGQASGRGAAARADAVAAGDAVRWGEVRLWIDKCCVQQGDAVQVAACVELFEEFIQLSDGVLVLPAWNYFERLWCVYEWACFTMFHEPEDVVLCADAFLRPKSLPLFLKSIRNFSLDRCQCFHAPDREILRRKVDQYYTSVQAFETFVRFTAVAFFGRCMTHRAGRASAQLAPWADLAEEFGFAALARELRTADQSSKRWRREAYRSASGSHWEEAAGGKKLPNREPDQPTAARASSSDVQALICEKSDAWFSRHIAPLVEVARNEAANPDALRLVARGRCQGRRRLFCYA